MKILVQFLVFCTLINLSIQIMSDSIQFINEKRVKELLDWKSTFDAMELALKSVSEKKISQNPRSFTFVPNTDNVLLSMPGYLENGNKSVLATKLVTSFPNNPRRTEPLSTILANIFLFDTETGQLKCVSTKLIPLLMIGCLRIMTFRLI